MVGMRDHAIDRVPTDVEDHRTGLLRLVCVSADRKHRACRRMDL
jgi:hypothetical protein